MTMFLLGVAELKHMFEGKVKHFRRRESSEQFEPDQKHGRDGDKSPNDGVSDADDSPPRCKSGL